MNAAVGTQKEWLCDFPWKYLNVTLAGDVSFCCTNPSARGSLREKTFEEIWNSEPFQMARAQFRDRRYLEAKCMPTCQWLIKEIPRYAKNFETGMWPVIDDGEERRRYSAELKPNPQIELATDFTENLATIEKDVAAETLITRGRPIRAQIAIIQSCNLYCNFCDIGVGRPKERFMDDLILERLKPAYRFLNQIEILGGEIFSIGIERSPLRRILDDIEQATAGNPEPIKVLLVTNAVSLGSGWANFLTSRKNLKLYISISIDTLDPEVYPKMRVGGKLEKTLENIRRLRQLIVERNANLDLIFTSVLCDLTYPSIPALVAFTKEMDAKHFMLQPLARTGDPKFYEDHNLFNGKRAEDVRALKKLVDEMPHELTNKQSIQMICNRYAPDDAATDVGRAAALA
jgi:MoaA/NifB/PqqE/SkfB family radical SAM enzyme